MLGSGARGGSFEAAAARKSRTPLAGDWKNLGKTKPGKE
jgi:hypothetical protein